MPRVKKREIFSTQKSIAIQTDNIDSNNEIIRLQEQLKLLQLENDTLKKHVNGNISSAKNVFDESKLEALQSPRRVNKNPKGNPQILKSATKLKQCNCKGNCSTKICGCVKNERKCGPTCKCDDEICQNQELENKENIGGVQNEIVHDAQKLEKVPLKDKVESQNLFSPEGIENETRLTNVQYEGICFDTPKKSTYTSDEELQTKNKDTIKIDVIKRRNKAQKKHKDVDDKEHVTVSKQNAKTKTQKAIATETDENKAQERSENELKIMQASQLSEEDNDMSMSKADTSFDPMKPKRQLPRTPPRGNIEYESDDVPTSVKSPTEEIEQKVDIPDELNQENVDLDELHIDLVSCDRCKRKFYPWRITKHESACLGL